MSHSPETPLFPEKPAVSPKTAPLSAETSTLLALSFLEGVGQRKLARLLALYGSTQALLDADRSALAKQRVTPEAINQLDELAGIGEQSSLARRSEEVLHWLAMNQAGLISIYDETYPKQLSMIADPPVLLYFQGNMNLLSAPQVAIVGSRRATSGGLDNAFQFARSLSRAGFVVTSGFALGIDARAHEGALQGAAGTVAVLGTGLDQTYPKRNCRLRPLIAERGVVISEFPAGTPPKRENFPQRNRIISGLSLAVLVIEADVRSGSLITARQALEQGRDVMAIPGSIHNPLARGCHQLIQQGAKLTTEVDDILVEIEPQMGRRYDNVCVSSSSSPDSPLQDQADLFDQEFSDIENEILSALGYERSDIDTLAEQLDYPVQEILNGIFMLELKGVIESVPGGYSRLSV
ncbi:MAG: DNA-protecting protein DprA [Gammaproteobacteria bacterium]|nr:MAG: DNA-protecting protein DprA [Pseudomonadota bacterium]PIE38302.1 MAG: DNA-protecting protein DprA [Gammaproteobacteria bacterium]